MTIPHSPRRAWERDVADTLQAYVDGIRNGKYRVRNFEGTSCPKWEYAPDGLSAEYGDTVDYVVELKLFTPQPRKDNDADSA